MKAVIKFLNPCKTEPERVPSYENMTGFHRVERVRRKVWWRFATVIVIVIGGSPCGHPPYVKPILLDGAGDDCGVYGG